jgi:hypothetical protein
MNEREILQPQEKPLKAPSDNVENFHHHRQRTGCKAFSSARDAGNMGFDIVHCCGNTKAGRNQDYGATTSAET